MKKETILVTGASSGIGLELARIAAADGHSLILVARNEERLRQLAQELQRAHGTQVTTIPLDLSTPGAAERLAAAIAERGLQVDGLINNAGYGLYGPFLEHDPADQLGIIQLNVAALTDLIQRFLPGMVSRGYGRILNVASVAAFVPGPYLAVYHATKAYVLSLSEALAVELRGTGVTVTALCPGPVITGFQERSQMGLTAGHRLMLVRADAVARQGYQAMRRGKRIAIPGLLNRLLVFGTRLAPRWGVAAAVGGVSRIRGR
jgi:short-subunit dehydrogenase